MLAQCHSLSLNAHQILVSGGFSRSGNRCSPRLCAYNPETNSVSRASKMSVPRYCHTTCLKGDHVYIVGGKSTSSKSGDVVLRACEVLDLRTWQTRTIAKLNEPRCRIGSVLMQNGIYVFGGSCGELSLRSIEKYDVEKDEWNLVSCSFVQGIDSYSVQKVTDQDVLICGGRANEIESDQIILFNANARILKSTGKLGRAQSNPIIGLYLD